MDNETFLNNMKYQYDSLKAFVIKNGNLLLKDNNNIYMIPLNINLSSLNNNIYLLNPRDIYRIIYMIELLSKEKITDDDVNFVNEYVGKYLNLEKKKNANLEVDENEVNSLGIPIYLSDDPKYENSSTSNIIRKILLDDLKEEQSGKTNTPRLVLTSPHFQGSIEEDNLANFEKAGFTTIILIVSAIVATCLYIAFFILT